MTVKELLEFIELHMNTGNLKETDKITVLDFIHPGGLKIDHATLDVSELCLVTE